MPDNPLPASLSEAIIKGSEDSEQLIGGWFNDKKIGSTIPNVISVSTLKGIPKGSKSSYGTAVKMIKTIDSLLYSYCGAPIYTHNKIHIHAFGLKQWGSIPEDDLKKMTVSLRLGNNDLLWQGNLHTMMQIEKSGCWVPLTHGLIIPMSSMVLFMVDSAWGHDTTQIQFELRVSELIPI